MSLTVRAVRQKALIREGPEVIVKGGEPLLGRDLDHRPPVPLQGLLQEHWKNGFQRLVLEVIEKDFRHRRSHSVAPDDNGGQVTSSFHQRVS
jgi:hypothetical protein